MSDNKKNDEITDALVRKTEVWPGSDDVFVPDELIVQTLIETGPHCDTLDLAYVTRKNTKAPRPAMVFVHGGSWKHGDKWQFLRQSMKFAADLDIFCVLLEYRLSDTAQYPAALHDCKAAVRWLRSVANEHHIDVNRIGICGGSAGAHLSAMVATTNGISSLEGAGPHRDHAGDVQLAVLFNGHFDMADQLKDHIQDGAMYDFFGGHPWEIPEVYGAASPFLRVCKSTPPMLLLHGDQDRFPHRQSIAMQQRLQHYGVHAELEIYPGKPHAWFNREPDLTITADRVARFLAMQFDLTAPTSQTT